MRGLTLLCLLGCVLAAAGSTVSLNCAGCHLPLEADNGTTFDQSEVSNETISNTTSSPETKWDRKQFSFLDTDAGFPPTDDQNEK
ncbi:hypothetical protein OJAV_G00196260 [Oryzias javanicus]|uniref:Uncharacterized protein n=1 Tax=Oryzias javanicus TaxID=123683 RepID=A0A3S2MG29_ORYJA|nr:hypothetical protein OJAV_G00196260 [Oryzias javanicus]